MNNNREKDKIRRLIQKIFKRLEDPKSKILIPEKEIVWRTLAKS